MSMRRIRKRSVLLLCLAGLMVAVLYWKSARVAPTLVFPASDPNTGCGSASLALVGHWLGSPRPMAELNELTKSYDSGTSSLADLKSAALAMGLFAEAVKIKPDRPLIIRSPIIIHLNGNHFAAILPLDREKLIFSDPPHPPSIMNRDSLSGSWKGIALVVAKTKEDLNRSLATQN